MNFHKPSSFRDRNATVLILLISILLSSCGHPMQAAGVDGDLAASLVTAPPPSPTDLNANVLSRNSVMLTWLDPSVTDDAASSYTIERATVSGTTVGMYNIVASIQAGTTAFTDNTVAPGTTYNYFVISSNADGASTPASIATITTPP